MDINMGEKYVNLNKIFIRKYIKYVFYFKNKDTLGKWKLVMHPNHYFGGSHMSGVTVASRHPSL